VPACPSPQHWFLDSRERGNPHARLYAGRDDGSCWTAGNQVTPLVDGSAYFARLCQELRGCAAGDLVYFADWRGDPDQHLDGPGSAVMVELARAESAGARVFGLVWRSHLDRLRFSEQQNRTLAEALQALNANVLLDMRVRRGGSHHQKFVVVRHPQDPARDVAFVGGIDLGHSRNDDRDHGGDPQTQPMPTSYGPTPPWHDAMVEIHGPAVVDVETCFRERWDDPAAPQHNHPWLWALDRLRDLRSRAATLPDPVPAPSPAGRDCVQLLRTYPSQSPAYPFAPDGERTVARGYAKALRRARRVVHVEDQFLWSATVAQVFADTLRRETGLHLVAVLPRYPDSEGGLQEPAKDAAHTEALQLLLDAGGDRVHLFDLENAAGTPIYVHAKVCVIDDTWAAVGSANLNRRSWTHDSELTAAVLTLPPDAGADPEHDAEPHTPEPQAESDDGVFARRLRVQLWAEHLGRRPDQTEDLADPVAALAILHAHADRLDAWHRDGGTGERPPGHLRAHRVPTVHPAVRRAVEPVVRTVIDPDGRPFRWRRLERW